MVNPFKNKKVLVTGHTGFKGSWLSLWLLELGANVCGYSIDFPSEPNLFTAVGLKERLEHRIGDIRDYPNLLRAFQEFKPDMVFHLAAQPLVRHSYEEPKETFDTNAGGVVNILECVRKTSSVRFFMNVTSDKCYENREWLWGYREGDRLGGRDPYSCSKALSEMITSSYQQTFFPTATIKQHGVEIISARAGNVIGGGDWGKDRLIPDAMRALASHETILIRNPKSIRPWQHVLDCLSGYLTLAQKAIEESGVYTGAWNFGPMNVVQVTVEKILEKVLKCWGAGDWKVVEGESQKKHEATFLYLYSDKATTLLKWRPMWDIEKAVTKTVQWYREYYENPQNTYDLCQNQLREYIATQNERNKS